MKLPSGPRPSEPTAHTYTHTHTPSIMRQGITWTSSSHSFGFCFPFGRPNPKYPPPDHPGGAGSKTIGRNPITHTKVSFAPFFFVCFVLRDERKAFFRYRPCLLDNRRGGARKEKQSRVSTGWIGLPEARPGFSLRCPGSWGYDSGLSYSQFIRETQGSKPGNS